MFILDFTEVIRERFLNELKNDTITPLRMNHLLNYLVDNYWDKIQIFNIWNSIRLNTDSKFGTIFIDKHNCKICLFYKIFHSDFIMLQCLTEYICSFFTTTNSLIIGYFFALSFCINVRVLTVFTDAILLTTRI